MDLTYHVTEEEPLEREEVTLRVRGYLIKAELPPVVSNARYVAVRIIQDVYVLIVVKPSQESAKCKTAGVFNWPGYQKL